MTPTSEPARSLTSVPVLRRASVLVAGLAAVMAALAAAPAQAQPGVPRTYDVTQIDSPAPEGTRAFGWGITSGDFTGDGKIDLLSVQSQGAPTGRVFLFDGPSGRHIDTIEAPETNPNNNPGIELSFPYIERMPDIGSCPGGDGGDADKICDAATIGGGDGIPEILAGGRGLRVNTTNGAALPTAADPAIGRGYVLDGATRVVLKRIDMPAADRQLQQQLAVANVQFARMIISPQGLPPCAGSQAEANNMGVGPCPGDPLYPRAVRIGDATGGGYPDIVITARQFAERAGAPPPAPATPRELDYAAPGSQCRTSPGTATSCPSGRAWVYRGEDIVGTDPRAILETPAYTLRNPFAQTGGQEYGGNVWRIGDVGGSGAGNTAPDGRPDIIIGARQLDYPLANPDPAGLPNVGAAFLFSGPNGALLNTYAHPETQARAEFAGSFNSGMPAGDLGLTDLPDVLLPAPLQNNISTDDGETYAMRGDVAPAPGGHEGGWNFASVSDATPDVGGGFGSSQTGVGNLVGGPSSPANEMLIGSWGPFDPGTEAAFNVISDVHLFNPQTQRLLQTIPDPQQEAGSGFGVGMTPMGDLNEDGFLDYAISSYLSNAPPDGQGGQGRAFILTSNNSPAPPPPDGPGAEVSSPQSIRAGDCTNRTVGTAQADQLKGTIGGDEMFGFGGDDLIEGFQSADCLDGGDDKDQLEGGDGNDRLIGRSGEDRLLGRDENDRLFGGSGSDRLLGGLGRDLLAGGPGNDRLDGGKELDRLFGEAGNDRLKVGRGPTARNRADGGSGNDVIDARNGRIDTVICGRGRDRVLTDKDGKDRIRTDCERVQRK